MENKVKTPKRKIRQTAKGFEDDLKKLAEAQAQLSDKVRNALSKAHIPQELYIDWLDDYCLYADNNIKDLIDIYKERHPVCKKIKWEAVRGAISWLRGRSEKNGCYHFKVAEVDDREYCIVIGWRVITVDDGPGEKFKVGNSEFRARKSHEEYEIAWKIAYQSKNNAMQCDFDVDWTMPYDEESGDVYCTACGIDDTIRTAAKYRSLATRMNKEAQSAVDFDLECKWDKYAKERE